MPTGETRLTLQTKLAALLADSSISNANIQSFIESAHLMFPGTFFVDHADESITLATSTYEYALPETSSVSTFVRIDRIDLESSDASGLFDAGELVEGRDYRVIYDGTGVWQLEIKRHIVDGAVGRKIRIVGQRKPVTPAADGDVIELHPGWLLHYCLFLGHGSRGGTNSDLANWHRMMAGAHMKAADEVADNMNNRAHPGSIEVPGVF